MAQLTKGQVLVDLKSKLSGKGFVIPKIILIKYTDWIADKNKCLFEIKKTFGNKNLILRSSFTDEDLSGNSQAGAYESVLNVNISKIDNLICGFEKVFDSYLKRNNDIEIQEIIIQEMINDTSISGVVLTHELNTGAPYYVINYDDQTGLTNTVTSGEGNYSNKTLYIHRDSINSLRSERFSLLVKAIKELEAILKTEFIDLEFAIKSDLKLFLFQARPISTKSNWNRGIAKKINQELLGIENFVKKKFSTQNNISSHPTVLGQMPDWNPAEMIGRVPRALSFSLYSTLITNKAWRDARKIMKYNIPDGQPLMLSIAGQPFIDTRLSFLSFLPSDLPKSMVDKICNKCIDRLKRNPELHDKIEFEIAITSFTFDIDEKIQDLFGDIITEKEAEILKKSFQRLTHKLIIGNDKGSISDALKKIKFLESIDLNIDISNFSSLQKMIENCIEYGTIPFSILARHGFIARSLMLSLIKKGICTKEDIYNFQASISTVASELVESIKLLQTNKISSSEFMKLYGHLRPGTYDILSPRYDQIDNFPNKSGYNQNPKIKYSKFNLTEKQRKSIDELLEKEKMLGIDSYSLFEYFESAISGREYGKFIFTRSVSAILELIANFGDNHGLSREEMSHIPISSLLEINLNSISESLEQHLRSISEENYKKHVVSNAIRLPQILYDEAGIYIVPFQVSQPNFVTDKNITGEVFVLNARNTKAILKDKIVLIENADPGFDWIFSQSIAGLVTKYGGANSHMAIRCAEFEIPAAIGCGEQRFESFLFTERLNLNCSAGLITFVN